MFNINVNVVRLYFLLNCTIIHNLYNHKKGQTFLWYNYLGIDAPINYILVDYWQTDWHHTRKCRIQPVIKGSVQFLTNKESTIAVYREQIGKGLVDKKLRWIVFLLIKKRVWQLDPYIEDVEWLRRTRLSLVQLHE